MRGEGSEFVGSEALLFRQAGLVSHGAFAPSELLAPLREASRAVAGGRKQQRCGGEGSIDLAATCATGAGDGKEPLFDCCF